MEETTGQLLLAEIGSQFIDWCDKHDDSFDDPREQSLANTQALRDATRKVITEALRNGLIDEDERYKVIDELKTLYPRSPDDQKWIQLFVIKGHRIVQQVFENTAKLDAIRSRLESLDSKAEKEVLKEITQLEDANTTLNLQLDRLRDLSAFIVDKAIYRVTADDCFYKRDFHKDMGQYLVACRDTALYKSQPRLFLSNSQQVTNATQKEFLTLLEDFERLPNAKTVSFRTLGPQFFNMAPSKEFWLKPIYGEQHHEFFDLLFEALCADERARKNVVDSIAWKYWHPELINLPSPIFVGRGGAGKTLVAKIFEAIVGQDAVHWTAKLSEDTLKNNAFLVGKWILNFDEVTFVRPDSKEYEFIKKTVHAERIEVRDVYVKSFKVDNTAWIWFACNNKDEEHSAIPLAGDGDAGVDRRFTPIIVRQTLVQVIQKHHPDLTEQQAKEYIKECVDHVLTNDTEVARWLGNVIDASGVKKKPVAAHPRAYHGPDYVKLTSERQNYVADVCDFVFKQEQINAIKFGDLYSTYIHYCDASGIKTSFRKNKQNFNVAVRDYVSENLTPDYEVGKFRVNAVQYVPGSKTPRKAETQIVIRGIRKSNNTDPYDVPWLTSAVDHSGKSITIWNDKYEIVSGDYIDLDKDDDDAV